MCSSVHSSFIDRSMSRAISPSSVSVGRWLAARWCNWAWGMGDTAFKVSTNTAERRELSAYSRVVTEGSALIFHPGVGFQSTLLFTHADAQVGRDALAAKQPPDGQRLRQAVALNETMNRGNTHQPPCPHRSMAGIGPSQQATSSRRSESLQTEVAVSETDRPQNQCHCWQHHHRLDEQPTLAFRQRQKFTSRPCHS